MTSFPVHFRRAGLAVVVLSALAPFRSAYADGTLSGTDISNSASVSFTVGGVSQTPVDSNTATFKVDRKVDLTVTAGAATTTNPNQANVAAIYTVSNTGNGTDSFTLAPANQPGDDFEVSNLQVYRDDGATPGVFDGGDTEVTAAISFTADESATFFIVSDIPITATNGQSSLVRLTATTTSTETAGADDPNVVDVVFADAGGDGAENDDNQYDIEAASLEVVKSAAVVSDPVNNTGPGRKAIPGAVIQYTIVVTNNGSAGAADVTLTDAIPTNTTYVDESMTLEAGALTDAADADEGAYNGTEVSVDVGSVGASASSTVTFQVTIDG